MKRNASMSSSGMSVVASALAFSPSRTASSTTTSLPPTQYSFDDFLSRLERSPEHHLPPLYTENALLFESRPDMLLKALGSVSWRRACTLLSAARFRQTLPVSAYRVALAQMVKHNRSNGCDVGGQGTVGGNTSSLACCDWRVAMRLVADAQDRFGAEVPSRMYTSALRCCVPTQKWEQAIQVIKCRVKVLHDHEQLVAFPVVSSNSRRSRSHLSSTPEERANRSLFYISQLPRHTLVETVMACATDQSWVEALRLLDLCAAASPATFFLPSRGAEGRTNPHSLLPETSSSSNSAGEFGQKTTTAIEKLSSSSSSTSSLLDLVAPAHDQESAPSFFDLPSSEKARVLEVLCQVSSVCPNDVLSKHPILSRALPYVLTLGTATERGSLPLRGSNGSERQLPVADEFRVGYLPISSELQSQQRLLTLCLRGASWSVAIKALFPHHHREHHNNNQSKYRTQPSVSYTPAIVAALLHKLPLSALQQGGESSSSPIIPWLKRHLPRSVLLHKDVTTTLLTRYVAAGNVRGALSFVLQQDGANSGDDPSFASSVGGTEATAVGGNGTSSGGENSLALSSTPLHTDVASTLVLHLWRAGDTRRCVEFLRWCSQSKTHLSKEAMVGAMECMAKETMVRVVATTTTTPGGDGDGDVSFEYPPHGVHWKTALSWAVSLPSPESSASSSPSTTKNALPHPSHSLGTAATPPLHPRTLSILVFLCAAYGSPHGALRALAYARVHGADAGGRGGIDVRHWKALEAVLFCGMYNRPAEAAAIVSAQQSNGKHTPEAEQLAKLVAFLFRDSH